MPVSMLGNKPKQQIKGAVFNCVNLNKWWENLYFKLTPSEVRWVKMFCFDSPIKCKRAPSVEKILKSFHVDNTCSEDITVAAFMHLTLVFWKLGRNWLLSRSRLFCIYNFSVKWEVLNNIYEKWIQAQAPDSGSRLQDQALGCRSKLRGSGLSMIHASSA